MLLSSRPVHGVGFFSLAACMCTTCVSWHKWYSSAPCSQRAYFFFIHRRSPCYYSSSAHVLWGLCAFPPVAQCVYVIGDDGGEGEEDVDDGGATSAEFILSPGLRLLVRGGAEVRANFLMCWPCSAVLLFSHMFRGWFLALRGR